MNYYSFHVGDYRRDTTHLSMLEHGAYRQLLDWIYLDEKPIPKETQVVFRRLSARTEEEKTAIQTVLKEMFVLRKDGYVQARSLNEINNYKVKRVTARENGKLGGRPKKTKVVNSGLSKITQEKANHKPITNNHKPITNKQTKTITPSGVSSFDSFYKIYPVKKGKQDAIKAWGKCKDKPTIDVILKALSWQTKTDQWKKGIIPYPATYINGRRWEDEPDVTLNPGSNGADQHAKWWETPEQTIAKGRALGMNGLDETMDHRELIELVNAENVRQGNTQGGH